jgi:23S rRNA pseudouridine2457 synthase
MRYLLLNKPYEVLTQFTDEHGRATLKDFVAVPNVYPVGRLDFDSEGLLLLTDDKQLQHRLSDPRYKVPKTYWAQVEGQPTEAALQQLREGVQIKEGFTLPAEAEELPEAATADLWSRNPPIRYRASIPTSWVEITISQGMNRQVRKMCAAVNLPCLRLVRQALGDLSLAGLAPGEWRDLTEEEVATLRGLAGAGERHARPATPRPTAPRPNAAFSPTNRGPRRQRP